ncbi:MAG: SOS response-associated peptidase [Methanomassiliicoccus sp.]|nr:SOS response-associated peptidase [Methanomassiliicoccus sp.]
MCGRFTIGEIKDLIPRFSIDAPIADMPRPRYNLAPTQDAPIVIRNSPNRLVMMRWGLIPHWAKDPRIGSRMINARAEGVAERPAFRASLKDRRCLVPTTGFYEWAADGKVPYLAKLKDEGLFAMAGLYDRWRDPSGGEVLSFTIITTVPNALMAPIHGRMPVILSHEDEEVWLGPAPLEGSDMDRIFRPFPAERMEAYPVSRAVNDLHHDSEDLMRPAPRPDPGKWF